MVAQFRKPTKDTTKNYREPVWAGWFCRQHLHRCLVVKLDDLMINNYIKVKKVVP